MRSLFHSSIGPGLVTALACLCTCTVTFAQFPQQRRDLREPVYRVARQPESDQTASADVTVQQEHPLMPAIRLAKHGLKQIDDNIKDYQCTLIKRERIDNKVGDYQYIFTKVRHNPFSVYMYFLGPADTKGRECLYVAGKYENKLVAHEAQGLPARFGTVHLDPGGFLAMRGQLYPITEVGVRNLTARLVEVAEADTKFGECEVKFFKNAKVNGRVCTGLQVMHPVPRENFRFHLAQVFIDDELQIPIRYASYDWPKKQGDTPELIEEYTYLNMKINNGFTDADFDHTNQNYNFQ